jgi:hypothetical protein
LFVIVVGGRGGGGGGLLLVVLRILTVVAVMEAATGLLLTFAVEEGETRNLSTTGFCNEEAALETMRLVMTLLSACSFREESFLFSTTVDVDAVNDGLLFLDGNDDELGGTSFFGAIGVLIDSESGLFDVLFIVDDAEEVDEGGFAPNIRR